ncbi:hypothetical protein V1477_012598 [Vespula maculifrons]|uniref:Uncharacterized protein n=1 Tax=Vespula maculifrons TaxID=7453 RepID=A0ABD2BTI0_VESMC
MQQPPRGGTWVGSTCVLSKSCGVQRSDISSHGSVHNPSLGANTGRIKRTFVRVSAGTGVVFSGAIKSPTIMDFV